MGMKNWCRHFTGIQNDACKEGIAYASVRVKPESGPYQWPCLFSGGACAKQSAYTAEEIAEHERASKIAIEGMLKARAAIVSHGGNQGIIDCPVCQKGQLSYSKAKINGHIHAACSTAGCVRWME